MVSAAGTGGFSIDETPKNIVHYQIPRSRDSRYLTKSMTSISAESATLKMPFWTGSTGFIDIEISEMSKEMKIPILDPIDAEIATMTEDEINAEIDALFGSWVGKSEFSEAAREEMWGGWADKLASMNDDETEANSF